MYLDDHNVEKSWLPDEYKYFIEAGQQWTEVFLNSFERDRFKRVVVKMSNDFDF